MPRTGRRTGDPDTRREILAAARAAFSEAGYDKTTIRRIAADACVDPALVHHYFGAKEDLYAEAIDVPISPSVVAAAISEGDLEGAGERIATLFFSIWETPEGREPLLAMLRGAMTGNDAGTDAFREFISSALLGRIAQALTVDDRDLRVTLVAGHLLGVAILRYVIELEPIASTDIDTLIDTMAPRIQTYLTG